MSAQKFHYFLIYATFIDGSTGEINNVSMKQGYGKREFNLTGLKFIESQVEAFAKSKNPSFIPQNIDIKSLSYLGEMTETEFNS
ncbi:hypothetical protein [Acinetobacter pittii]